MLVRERTSGFARGAGQSLAASCGFLWRYDRHFLVSKNGPGSDHRVLVTLRELASRIVDDARVVPRIHFPFRHPGSPFAESSNAGSHVMVEAHAAAAEQPTDGTTDAHAVAAAHVSLGKPCGVQRQTGRHFLLDSGWIFNTMHRCAMVFSSPIRGDGIKHGERDAVVSRI